MRRKGFQILAIGLAIALFVGPARAQVTQTSLLVAGRTIGFIETLKPGVVQVAIVYDPGVAQSAQQADEIRSMMGDGLRIGNLLLKPVMTPIAKIGINGNGGNRRNNLYFLTEGVGAAAANVGRASRAQKIACITFDLEQVRNGTCALGVRSQPKIEVYVNRAAAQASGMELAAVFRMMITEM